MGLPPCGEYVRCICVLKLIDIKFIHTISLLYLEHLQNRLDAVSIVPTLVLVFSLSSLPLGLEVYQSH